MNTTVNVKLELKSVTGTNSKFLIACLNVVKLSSTIVNTPLEYVSVSTVVVVPNEVAPLVPVESRVITALNEFTSGISSMLENTTAPKSKVSCIIFFKCLCCW